MTRNSKSKPQSSYCHTKLHKKNLNVSAGRQIYERARSRRMRHRDVLKKLDSFQAIPLNRGGARGPGSTSNFYSENQEEEYLPKKPFRVHNRSAVGLSLRKQSKPLEIQDIHQRDRIDENVIDSFQKRKLNVSVNDSYLSDRKNIPLLHKKPMLKSKSRFPRAQHNQQGDGSRESPIILC